MNIYKEELEKEGVATGNLFDQGIVTGDELNNTPGAILYAKHKGQELEAFILRC